MIGINRYFQYAYISGISNIAISAPLTVPDAISILPRISGDAGRDSASRYNVILISNEHSNRHIRLVTLACANIYCNLDINSITTYTN